METLMIPLISPRLKSLVSCVGVVMIVALASGQAIAQGNGRSSSLPFANTYSKPKLSPYSALANINVGAAAGAGGGGGANDIYQNQILPRLELERQQIYQYKQTKQISGLQNQVQSIQRGTQGRQIDEMIRPTGHASTYLNLSHYYPNR